MLQAAGLSVLPAELLEPLLLKAVSSLCVVYSKLTSRHDVIALSTVTSVSIDWWRTVAGRDFNRRLLRKQIHKGAYDQQPQLVHCIGYCTQGGKQLHVNMQDRIYLSGDSSALLATK